MPKPRIGYTTRNFSIDPLQWLIALSILICGGNPVRLKPKSPHYDDKIDGLIISGGIDLYPSLYAGDPKPNYKYDQARDELEVRWLRRAEQEKMPVLGICRGAQLLNILRGGSLHTDVSKVYENAKYPTHAFANIFYRKSMNIVSGSQLDRILKTRRIQVNSMHKQAINIVGRDLEISAQEDNGVVQAIEDKRRDFYMGVQFHPEALIYKPIFRQLFKQLIISAKS